MPTAMLNCLIVGCLLVAGLSMAAEPATNSAAMEAYRRLPYCRLAPDGRHLAEEPCRRPPTRSQAQRRGAGSQLFPAAQSDAPHAASHAVSPPRPVPPVTPSVPPAIQPLNQCDLAGCRGGNGTLYQQGAGDILLDPSGRMCTRHGQWVHCQ